MIVRRIVQTLSALAVMTAAAGVVVVAAAFALYTLLRDYLGPVGAAAVIAAAFAVVLGAAALVFLRGAKGQPAVQPAAGPPPSLAGRVFDVVRGRPLVAAGAAAAAGLIAWRNPQLVAAVLRAFEPQHGRDND